MSISRVRKAGLFSLLVALLAVPNVAPAAAASEPVTGTATTSGGNGFTTTDFTYSSPGLLGSGTMHSAHSIVVPTLVGTTVLTRSDGSTLTGSTTGTVTQEPGGYAVELHTVVTSGTRGLFGVTGEIAMNGFVLGPGTTGDVFTMTGTLTAPDVPVITPGGVGVWEEGDSGSTVWDLPVTLSAPSADPVSIDWATVDTSADPLVAQAGTDFVSATGTVTFAPGETTQTIQIEILGDTLDEPPLLGGEWGLVAFSNPTNALLDTSTFGRGLFIIFDDDDSPPVITPGGVGVWEEGDSGSTVWDLPVTLSAPSADPVSIDWATVDTSADPLVAQAGTDFVSATGTVTFAPGETTQTIQIEILGDTLDEPPLLGGEWGLVAFSNPTNALLDTATFGVGLFIIFDDDP